MQNAALSRIPRTAKSLLTPEPPNLARRLLASNGSQQTVEQVLRSFNTWSFKREQPTERDLLQTFVANRIQQSLPVLFILYWGKGPRNHIAKPDEQCLEYLNSLKQRICEQYPDGAELTLCLTDTHARHNGHDEHTIRSYYNDVRSVAHLRGFKTTFLSDLVHRHETADVLDEALDGDMLDDLKRCAGKWYRGDGEVEQGAREYFMMNMIERRAVETSFPESIFITFNGSSYRSLFPAELPVFYMYSLRKGTCVKPWFLDGRGNPYNDAGSRSATRGWQ